MSTPFRKAIHVISLGAAMTWSLQASSMTLVVDDPGDPTFGNAADCTAPTQPHTCSLRDALLAADATLEPDAIRFEVDQTIHISKQLIAETPVWIDGGESKTTVRVAQGYRLTTLPDRFAPHGPVTVLQPDYYSLNSSATPQAMLVLRGHGSLVTNLVLDGSITPTRGDARRGASRIDLNSDDNTDFFLFTVDGRWLVGSGLHTASSVITANEMRYMRSYGMAVENSSSARITGNRVRAGGAGQRYYSGDGIWVTSSAFPVVADNQVSGYRTGIALTQITGASVTGNHAWQNGHGISFDYASDLYGPNLIDDNEFSHNLVLGMVIASVGPAAAPPAQPVLSVTRNRMRANGNTGINIYDAAFIHIAGNDVEGNGAGDVYDGGIQTSVAMSTLIDNRVRQNTGFGIVVAGPSNSVKDNTVTQNLGGGIILFQEGAVSNTIESNLSENNDYGILSVAFNGNFPKYNTISYNTLQRNATADAADFAPQCDNNWANNEFDSQISGSGACVQ